MVDANIIIFAGLFPESNVGIVLSHIVNNHELVLCQHTLDELENVFKNKFPKRIEHFKKFIDELKFDLVEYRAENYDKYPKMRDIDDLPLLVCAIETKVNLLVTGDKDFDEIIIETPKIMKPRKYIEEYIIKPTC